MIGAAERLLSMAEVGAFTGRSTRSVRRWIKDGKLRAARLGGSVWVREGDLMRALNGDAEPSSVRPAPAEKDDV